MASEPSVEFRYQPRYCTLLGKYVWAIRTRQAPPPKNLVGGQADGTWRTVNCLDKDEDCFRIECAFTTDNGEWPYKESQASSCSPL